MALGAGWIAKGTVLACHRVLTCTISIAEGSSLNSEADRLFPLLQFEPCNLELLVWYSIADRCKSTV